MLCSNKAGLKIVFLSLHQTINIINLICYGRCKVYVPCMKSNRMHDIILYLSKDFFFNFVFEDNLKIYSTLTREITKYMTYY